MLAITLFYLRN